MSDDGTQGQSWNLGSLPRVRPGGGQPWDIEIGEPISDEEFQSHQENAGLLEMTLRNSPFAALQQSYIEFKDAIERLANGLRDKTATPQMAQVIPTRLDEVLTGLRRFADRTSHSLSQRYGKDSRECVALKEALAYEFDNEFAYRLAWHLRNYSDHRGNVPYHISENSELAPDGRIIGKLQVLTDSTTLLPGYDWHARVRRDLENINGEFRLDEVIDNLKLSCNRAYCKTLLVQENGLKAAAANIKSLADRVHVSDDRGPVLIKAPASGIGTITISSLTAELADIVETTLQQARVIAA